MIGPCIDNNTFYIKVCHTIHFWRLKHMAHPCRLHVIQGQVVDYFQSGLKHSATENKRLIRDN